MDIFGKVGSAYKMIKKKNSLLRPIFDNGSSQTERERELEKDLKADVIKKEISK